MKRCVPLTLFFLATLLLANSGILPKASTDHPRFYRKKLNYIDL